MKSIFLIPGLIFNFYFSNLQSFPTEEYFTSFQIQSKNTPEQKESGGHFVKVWTGNGNDQMNIHVVSAQLDNNLDLESGDEIGIFDGERCVGRHSTSEAAAFSRAPPNRSSTI